MLVAPLVFLIICIYTSIRWWKDISRSQSMSLATLTASLENTPQPYKGLEAFVLTELDQVIEDSLHQAVVTDDFISKFNGLEQNLTNISSEDLNKSLRVKPDMALGNITDKYVTDVDKEGFLFVPAMVLGTSRGSTNKVKDTEIIEQINKPDSFLKLNILMSRRIAGNLKDLESTQIFTAPGGDTKRLAIETKPVQSYFLTSTGVIRLYASHLKQEEQNRHYAGQFKPTTFFPDRPYFWATVKNAAIPDHLSEGTSYRVTDAFNMTKPYIDLGGNGIVVTLSRSIKAADVTCGLFFDFSFGARVKDIIKNRVDNLGGRSVETTWNVEGESVRVEPGSDKLNETEYQLLKDRILERNKNKSLSDIFGQIYVLSDGTKDGKVRFTVPLGRPIPSSQTFQMSRVSSNLLYCEMDLQTFERWISIKAAIIAISFTLFLGSIVLLVGDSVMKVREQDKSFQSVAQAMSQAPVAYCRLDEADEFIEMNEAFAKLAGYSTREQAENELIHKRKFYDLLADQTSRNTYTRIQELRKKKLEVEPYRVRIKTKSGDLEIEIHGASVSVRNRKSVPQTFGILLESGVQVVSTHTMLITPLFGVPNQPVNSAEVFVVMQFKEDLTRIYEDHIVSVARRLNLSIARADEMFTTRAVMLDIWAAICSARIIIADCTGRNPNVFYEIGIAHAVGKPVVLITQDRGDIPFDVQYIRYIHYQYTAPGMIRFERQLEKTITDELG